MATDESAHRPPRSAGKAARTAIQAESQATQAFWQQHHGSPTKYDQKYSKRRRSNAADSRSDVDGDEGAPSGETRIIATANSSGQPIMLSDTEDDEDDEGASDNDEGGTSSDSDANSDDDAMDTEEPGEQSTSAETVIDVLSDEEDEEPSEPVRVQVQAGSVAYPSEPESSSPLNRLPVSIRLMIIDHLDSSPFAIFSLMSTSKLWYTTLAHTIGAEAGWYRRCRILGAKIHSQGCKTWHATYLKRLRKKCLSCSQTAVTQYGPIWPGAPNWVIICRDCQLSVPFFRCLTRAKALSLNIPSARLDVLSYKLHQLPRRRYVQEYRERTVRAWFTLKVRPVTPYMNRAMQRAIDGYPGNKHLLKQIFDTAFHHPISVMLRDTVERLLHMPNITKEAYSNCLKLFLDLREVEEAAREAVKLQGVQIHRNDLQLADMALYEDHGEPFTWLDCMYALRDNALEDYVKSLKAVRERRLAADALGKRLVDDLDKLDVKAEKKKAQENAKAKGITLPTESPSASSTQQKIAEKRRRAELNDGSSNQLPCTHVDGCNVMSCRKCPQQYCVLHCVVVAQCDYHQRKGVRKQAKAQLQAERKARKQKNREAATVGRPVAQQADPAASNNQFETKKDKKPKPVDKYSLPCMHKGGCKSVVSSKCPNRRCWIHCDDLGRCKYHSGERRHIIKRLHRRAETQRAKKAEKEQKRAQNIVNTALKAGAKRSAPAPQVKKAVRTPQTAAASTSSSAAGSGQNAASGNAAEPARTMTSSTGATPQQKVKAEAVSPTRGTPGTGSAAAAEVAERKPSLGKRPLNSLPSSPPAKKAKTEPSNS